MFSLCGPRCRPPTAAEVQDARAGNDPTKTYYLRARMRGEGDRRWQNLARTVRQALIDQDLLGLRGISRLPHGDKADGFAAWLEQELKQKVLGGDGSWVRSYIRNAAKIAQSHAHQYTPAGQHDPLRIEQMENMTVRELQGIVAAAQQQITRAVSNAMMTNASPTKAANAVSGVIYTMRHRTCAMSEWMIARTHATTTLSIFRNARVQRVGIIPEKRRRRRKLGDAFDPDEPRDPHGRWTNAAINNLLSKPLYHGTARRDLSFTPGRVAYFTVNEKDARDIAEQDAESLEGGKPSVVKAILNVNNPAHLGMIEYQDLWQRPEHVARLKAAGFDSAIDGSAKTLTEIAVFDPETINVTDAKRSGPGSRTRKSTPSPSTIRRIEKTQRKIAARFEEGVDVLTAGDNDVCIVCEDISDEGPYDLDEAEGLIPAHPWCRCAFVPAGTMDDAWPVYDANQQAAGIIFRTPGGEMLLMKRSDTGEWSIPAGHLEENETPRHAAHRESAEETGNPGNHQAFKVHSQTTRGVRFHTYVQPAEWQFEPILNPEHTQYGWFHLENLPQPLHPGLVATLHSMTEGGGEIASSI
jgi:ADP-ribose pyrophosphatase YjhB (NUDIX family)